MPTPFESQRRNFAQLLGDGCPPIVVPEYQRGYSWKKQHVEAFWKDLDTFLADKRKKEAQLYFLGPIVTLEGDGKLTLLDGQQRLATATMVLAALRNAADEIGSVEFTRLAEAIHGRYIAKDDGSHTVGYSIQLGELDKQFFEELVQTRSTEITPKKAKLRSERAIKSAFSIVTGKIKSAIAGKPSSEQLKWLKEVFEAIKIDLIMSNIPVTNEKEAFQIFETLNDRGLHLSPADLLLNFLMKHSQDHERKRVREHWDGVLQTLGTKDANTFLRHVWVSNFGDLKKGDLFSALKQHIVNDRNLESLTYASECHHEAERYCAIQDLKPDVLFTSEPFVRTLLKTLECEAAMPLLLSANTLLSPSNFETVVKSLLAFVVRYSVICKQDTGEMESLLFDLARLVRQQHKKANEEGAPPDSKTRWQGQCVSKIKSELENKSPAKPKLVASIQELELSEKEALYIVERICHKLGSSTRELAANQHATNLEHIFPQNAKEPDWPNKEALEAYLWHVGNLTIIGENLNGKCGNRPFSAKCDVYRKSELKITNEIPAQYSIWDESAVIKRAEVLSHVADDIWNLDNTSFV